MAGLGNQMLQAESLGVGNRRLAGHDQPQFGLSGVSSFDLLDHRDRRVILAMDGEQHLKGRIVMVKKAAEIFFQSLIVTVQGFQDADRWSEAGRRGKLDGKIAPAGDHDQGAIDQGAGEQSCKYSCDDSSHRVWPLPPSLELSTRPAILLVKRNLPPLVATGRSLVVPARLLSRESWWPSASR